VRTERLSEVVDLVRGNVDPSRFADESFCLYSIPGHDCGKPEAVTGRQVGSSKTVVRAGDVLFSKLNPRIPRVWIVTDIEGSSRAICSTEFLPLRIKQRDLLTPGYLRLMCLAPQFLGPVQAAVNSSTRSHQRVRPEVLLEQPIPVPRVDEQQRIEEKVYECLTRVGEMSNLQSTISEEFTSLLPSAINSLVREDWPRRPLVDICSDIRNGWSGRQSISGTQVGVLRLSCVHTLRIDTSDVKPGRVEPRVMQECGLRKTDVFVVRGNGSKHLVGRSAIASGTTSDVIFNDLLIRLRFREEIIPAFANYMLHSAEARDQIELFAKTAAGIWKINQTNLGLVQIPCPPVVVQQRIADALDEARAISDNLLNTTTEIDIDALRNGILRQAFAGEL
jgi:type I restriction enzyme S subunit